jgi:hypothetical protein
MPMHPLRLSRTVGGLALIAAPVVFAASTFFWIELDGRVEYGLTGGALIVAATTLWIPAFGVLFGFVETTHPRTALFGWLAAIYGCIGGAVFGVDGMFAEAYRLSHDLRMTAWAASPAAFGTTMFWPGPLFPLSLLILGLLFVRAKATPLWTGWSLAAAGVAFPLSRIPRVGWIAHAADALLVIPLVLLGWRLLRSAGTNDRSAATADRRAVSAGS